ncbi:MAG: chromosome partitioning protein ParB [Rhodothalassiaceae bacterium]|nr:MAG: chromosome partitioning protein ParB [Rhodothalassiaceae bacterium]
MPDPADDRNSEPRRSSGRRRGLGRGLSALLGELEAEAAAGEDAPGGSGVRRLPITRLRPGRFQPRRHFTAEDLGELAASLRKTGMLQPILVRPLDEEDPEGPVYEIVAGERRWRAAQAAGLHEVPVIERRLEDAEALEIALVENIQRRDLTPIEEARAYRRLIDEFGYGTEEVGRLVGKSRSHVANLLRLLQLPQAVQEMVEEGALAMGHARALVGVPDAEFLARRIAAEGLSVRAVEDLAAGAKAAGGGRRGRARRRRVVDDPDIRDLAETLGRLLGTRVDIRHRPDGGGRLVLHYRNIEQLDRFCRMLDPGRGF